MKPIWDEAFLKEYERDARENALRTQSDVDWDRAVLRFERGMSNVARGFEDCELRACRRARRCTGNRPVCMPRCKLELEYGAEQELVDQFYAEIQQERRKAAAEGRAPNLPRAMKRRVQEEDHADAPLLTPDRGEPERNRQIARQVSPRDEPPSPPPQPQVRKPEPPAAAPPVPPAAMARPAAPAATAAPPPPTEPELRSSPEVEERVNRIWDDYVAGKPMPRPEPRIRSLSDERPWGVPPWWKGPR